MERRGDRRTRASHICLPAHNNDNWKLEGPDGSLSYRPGGDRSSPTRRKSSANVIAGAGIALRSTWDIGRELREGAWFRCLPQWEGSAQPDAFRRVLSEPAIPTGQGQAVSSTISPHSTARCPTGAIDYPVLVVMPANAPDHQPDPGDREGNGEAPSGDRDQREFMTDGLAR